MTIGTIDLETTTWNKGNPYDPRNFIVTVQTKREDQPTDCKFFDAPDWKTTTRNFLANTTLLVGVNLKFDLAWLRNEQLHPAPGCRIWDCMLAEFILSGQTSSFASLNSLCDRYGIARKEEAVAEYWDKGVNTHEIPRDVLQSYGCYDVDATYLVYQAQLKDPRMTPERHRLIILCGLDLLVLMEMEYNGMKYDKEASKAEAEKLIKDINACNEELFALAGLRFNIDSGDQLSAFLYGGWWEEDIVLPVEKVYKSGPKKGQTYVRNEYQRTERHVLTGFFKPLKGTEVAKSTPEKPVYQTGDEVLQQLRATTKVQRRIIELLRTRSKLEKLVGTYLLALPAMCDEYGWGDYVHGQFNQVVARTGRLSSSKPNMQNAPSAVDAFFISRYAD